MSNTEGVLPIWEGVFGLFAPVVNPGENQQRQSEISRRHLKNRRRFIPHRKKVEVYQEI